MRDNGAVSVVMAFLMAMMIVFGTITGILAWGIPYIEDREREYQLQAAFSQFDILDKKLTSLIQTGAGVTENIYIENSNDKGSIIITTNLTFDRWNEIFKDPMLTGAIVDRLAYKAHILDLSRESSYRFEETNSWLKSKQ